MKIFFAGDYAPCRRYENIVLEKRKSIFGNLMDDILESDISFVNLETPLSITGKPIKKSGPNIKAHPDCIHALADAGFSVVGLANNHILDFGEKGLEETLNACRKVGVSTCGAGKSLHEAQQPLVIEKDGIKVGYIAVAEHEFSIAEKESGGAAPLDPIDNSLLIENLRKNVGLLFVTIHGGNEYFPYPRPGLRKICRFYVEKGADAVICHHAHVPGAYEVYKGKPIVYSLGNLIFDHPNPPNGWNQGYAFRLEYVKNSMTLSSFKLIPYTQSVKQGGVLRIADKERENFLQIIESYRDVLTTEKKYENLWLEFCEKKRTSALLNMFLPFRVKGIGRVYDILKIEDIIVPEKYLFKRQNMLRCESHIELFNTILKDKIENRK
ncbi:MAG: CapA family protein [Desulforegulaceae bacterium]|nr:CapA family protein [Desulforegulaceae bacterium]